MNVDPHELTFEPIDGGSGPALPLSAQAAHAQADAIVARHRRRRVRLRVGLSAGAVLFAASLAFAAVQIWNPPAPATRSSPPATPATPGAELSKVQVEPLPSREPARAREPQRALPQPAAGDQLELANAARARREFARAERLYLRVAALDANSGEAIAANLSAAELRSLHLGRPRDALPLYRKVLLAQPSAALAEQARVGIARSHAALGDVQAERAAWLELLAEHPQSWFAGEARARLSALADR